MGGDVDSLMEEAGHNKAQHGEMEIDDMDSDDSRDYPEF